MSDHATEDFIKNLPWSAEATDWDKLLVAGNLRGFAKISEETFLSMVWDWRDRFGGFEAQQFITEWLLRNHDDETIYACRTCMRPTVEMFCLRCMLELTQVASPGTNDSDV